MRQYKDYECCTWGSCRYTTTNNMFDVMRDLTRVGVDPVQAVVPPNILVNIYHNQPLLMMCCINWDMTLLILHLCE